MRVIFMGTPLFALETLEKIHEHHEVVGVFVQPDKPNSRGNKIQFSPIKQFALDNGLPLFQPTSVKKEESLELFKSLNADIAVVAAYGKILPQAMIDIPKYGIINVHASLLPQYRGASPIHQSLMNGDSETGVTIMNLVLELDAGDMILKKSTPISEEDNFETLHDRLASLGATACIEAMAQIENGTAVYTPQDGTQATFCGYITKEHQHIDFTKSSQEIKNIVRTFSPAPGAYAFINGKRVKIFSVSECCKSAHLDGKPGEIVGLAPKKGYIVRTKTSSVILTSLQPENKKRISGQDTLNGNMFKIGEQFS